MLTLYSQFANPYVSIKHVVLIDDVVTTGSTIETLVREINNVAPNTQVSVVTLAID